MLSSSAGYAGFVHASANFPDSKSVSMLVLLLASAFVSARSVLRRTDSRMRAQLSFCTQSKKTFDEIKREREPQSPTSTQNWQLKELKR